MWCSSLLRGRGRSRRVISQNLAAARTEAFNELHLELMDCAAAQVDYSPHSTASTISSSCIDAIVGRAARLPVC